jgi:hypothetical protein
MKILQGFGEGYLCCQDYTPQAWNGIVYYEKARSTATRVATPPPIQPLPSPPWPLPAALPIVTAAAGKLATTVVRGNGLAGNMVEIEEHCGAVF